jgi:hypothetical protein
MRHLLVSSEFVLERHQLRSEDRDCQDWWTGVVGVEFGTDLYLRAKIPVFQYGRAPKTVGYGHEVPESYLHFQPFGRISVGFD